MFLPSPQPSPYSKVRNNTWVPDFSVAFYTRTERQMFWWFPSPPIPSIWAASLLVKLFSLTIKIDLHNSTLQSKQAWQSLKSRLLTHVSVLHVNHWWMGHLLSSDCKEMVKKFFVVQEQPCWQVGLLLSFYFPTAVCSVSWSSTILIRITENN